MFVRYARYLLVVSLVSLGGLVLVLSIISQVHFFRYRSWWGLELVLPKGAEVRDVITDISNVYFALGKEPPLIMHRQRPNEGEPLVVFCSPAGCQTFRFTEGNVYINISPCPDEATKENIRSILAHFGTKVVAESSDRHAYGAGQWGPALLTFVISGILFSAAWELFRFYRSQSRSTSSRYSPM